MQVKFTILGEPKGKGRPRFSRKTGTAITPKDTVNYETLVHMEYLEQCNGFRFEDDAMLDLRIKAYYSIPKSTSIINLAITLPPLDHRTHNHHLLRYLRTLDCLQELLHPLQW